MKPLWAPWRMAYVGGDEKKAPNGRCIFCVEKDHGVPDKERLILYAGRLSMVMMNRYPYANGHLLAAPRRHVGRLSELSREEMGGLLSLVSRSIELLRREMSPDGFNAGLNLGQTAGAGYDDHLHFHIVPRWSGDTNFMPVLAGVRVIPEHLEASFDRLVKQFNDLPMKE